MVVSDSSLGFLKNNMPTRVRRALFRHDLWSIGIVHRPISDLINPRISPEVELLMRGTRDKYFADPFGLVKGGRIHVLCEEFDYDLFKGRIVRFEVSEGEVLSEPEQALDLSVHASYPYLVEEHDRIYCVPETAELGKVELYLAEDFPSRWSRVATLVDNFPGVDATIFRFDGKWWLTCTSDETGSKDKLYVWHADDLVGPWQPHAVNPVKSDVRSARPAGTPFIYEGELFRPAQDCSETYGGRIVLNRVATLTPVKFQEEQVRILEPQKGSEFPSGMHTLCAMGDSTLIDLKRDIFQPEAFKRAWNVNLSKIRNSLS